MPLIVIFPDDLTAEDQAALLAEYQAYREVNPDSLISFEEWLAMKGEV